MHTESKHKGVVRYKCDSMNYSYKTNDSKCLKEHSLRDHLKKHSGEKPNKCNQCDYASIRASTLRDHLKKHSGEKSNKCNQRDYASSRADSLRTHLKTHSGEIFFLEKVGLFKTVMRSSGQFLASKDHIAEQSMLRYTFGLLFLTNPNPRRPERHH